MECATSSIFGSASRISGATLSGKVSTATAERSHSLVNIVWSNSNAARSRRSRRKWRTSNQPKITPVSTVIAVATFAIVPISIPVLCRFGEKMKSRRFTRNLRLLSYCFVNFLFADDDAIPNAGFASAVIINVHTCSRPNPGGFDLTARAVHETNCLAQRIADWAVRAGATDDDGLARLESRDGTIGRCRRSSGFRFSRHRIGLRGGRLRSCACLRESKRRDRRASQNKDALFHDVPFHVVVLIWSGFVSRPPSGRPEKKAAPVKG